MDCSEGNGSHDGGRHESTEGEVVHSEEVKEQRYNPVGKGEPSSQRATLTLGFGDHDLGGPKARPALVSDTELISNGHQLYGDGRKSACKCMPYVNICLCMCVLSSMHMTAWSCMNSVCSSCRLFRNLIKAMDLSPQSPGIWTYNCTYHFRGCAI